MPHMNTNILRGFFDGTSQGDPLHYGVGEILFINQNHQYLLRYALGKDTITRDEFTSLWILLYTSFHLGVKRIQVLSDSKLVVDWANQIVEVNVPNINYIIQEITLEMENFEKTSYMHIYKELNEQTDNLSKKNITIA